MTDDRELKDHIQKYWQTVIDELVQSLQEVGRFASGVTAQSIGSMNVTPVKFRYDTSINVTIWMPDYYAYIDEGVSGAKENTDISRFKFGAKMPPISAIRQFMINRGIVSDDYRDIRSQPKNSQRKQAIDQSLNRLAFVIARAIWRRGLKPTHFYTKVVNDKKLLKFEQLLLTEYGRLIENIVDTSLDA